MNETPQTELDSRTPRPTTIAVVFEVTSVDRLRMILENNAYKISEASPCLWSAKKIACPQWADANTASL
jgi:hypothetical protein